MDPQTWFWRHSTGNLMRKKMRYLPGSVDLHKNWKPNNVDKVDHQKVEKKQCRKSGPPQSWKKTMSKKWSPTKIEKKAMSTKWVYICLYTFIYLHRPLYTPEYLCIPSYTPIYIKISNIRKMRSDIRPKKCHKWTPRGSPMARTWHAPYYHTPKGFFKPKGPQF